MKGLVSGFYIDQPILLQSGFIQTQVIGSGAVLILFEIRFKDILLRLSHKQTQSISALLETVVADSFSGILIATEDGEILEISHQATRMLGKLGYVTVKGNIIATSVPPQMVELLQNCHQDSNQKSSRHSLQTLTIAHCNTPCYFECSVTPSVISTATKNNRRVATLLFHDVTETKQKQLQLEYLADHDPVTDLYNKTGFSDGLDERMIAAMQNDALVFACQGSRTEKIAQSLGPEYCDLLMQQIGERLAKLTEFNVVGCSEQKEFLLGKIGATKNDTANLVKKIQQCLEAPYSIRGHNIIVGSHIGIADFQQGGLLAEEVVKAATVALHRSKETADECLFLYLRSGR